MNSAVLTVLIPTLNDEAVLGRALAPLVPAAVAGLVREVIVADGGSTDATLEIADDAGCRILTGQRPAEEGLRAAAREGVGHWLMLLRPSVQLAPGWETIVRQHIETRAGQGASLTVTDPGRSVRLSWFGALFDGADRPEVLIVERKAFVINGRPKSLRRLPGAALLIRKAG